MKLTGKNKLGFVLIVVGLGFSVWALWLRSRQVAVPLVTAERIGPTYTTDERASEVLAKVNTVFAEDDAKDRLAGYIAAARAVRPPRVNNFGSGGVNLGSGVTPAEQFRFEEELKNAYRNSGAYRDLDFGTFSSYARSSSTNPDANQPFAGFFGLLGLN